MRIAYIANVRLPNERAHGHQIAYVTDALRQIGNTVEIFAPYRKNPISLSFQEYYQLTESIPVHQLGSIDGIAAWWAPGVIGLKLTTALFKRHLKNELVKRNRDFDMCYTRSVEMLPALIELKKPVILELHSIPRLRHRHYLRLMRRCSLIVALTMPMRTALVEMGLTETPIVVEGDSVDLRKFENLPQSSEARALFSLPPGAPIVGYCGQLKSMGLHKGIHELLKAGELLLARGTQFHFAIAGGPENVRQRFMNSLSLELKPNVSFLGFIAHSKVPTFLNACDLLVYPAPVSDHPFYTRDTSPLKLFEYMAAGKPIVAADLPTIREVIDEKAAILFKPGDSEGLAAGIREALADVQASEERVTIARSIVENHTWIKRMQRIVGSTMA